MTIVYTFICAVLFVLVVLAIHMAIEQTDNSSPQTWKPKNPDDYAFPVDKDGQALNGFDLDEHIDNLIRKWQQSRANA